MAEQYIFTMQNLRKVVPPQREILRGIYLSFYPGAKIGILGLNGAGKSTVLRIMAGVDTEFTGEAFPAEGTRIGFLSQDPQLDPKKTVRENVEEGVAPVKKLLARFEELGEKMGESLPELLLETSLFKDKEVVKEARDFICEKVCIADHEFLRKAKGRERIGEFLARTRTKQETRKVELLFLDSTGALLSTFNDPKAIKEGAPALLKALRAAKEENSKRIAAAAAKAAEEAGAAAPIGSR